MTVAAVPWCIQSGSHSAQLFRQSLGTLINPAGGTVKAEGLKVTEHVAANLSVNIEGGVPGGQIWVPGTTSANVQSNYYGYNESTTNLGIAAADVTNPRIDTVVAQIKDAAYAGAESLFTLSVVTGTPTGGANLTNLNGKGAVPASSLVLAYVEVKANATTIANAEIKNVATQVGAGTSFMGSAAGAAYGALTGRTKGTEYEPSATRPAHVVAQLQGTAPNNPKLTVGGIIVSSILGATGTLTVYSFICPPAKKWKVEASEGTLESSYLLL